MTNNTSGKLEKDLCELAATLAWVDPEDVTPNTSLSDIGLDSLGSIELVARVEGHFGFMFPEKNIPKLDTVNEIINYAERVVKEISEASSA
ncbi:acyl carrier protein [Rheinheimera sp. NSM]|uniref:acyl carrier protein n=1 Tax=Rheinheimera sp. NSM TaxID=3457884 RepID=UPI00403518D3